MANYIGREPLNGFFTKQVIGHDGSTTTFALTHAVATTTSIIVSVNAVILQPDVGYTLSGGGNNIIFASAPGATTYIHYLGETVTQSVLDLNGSEFILDIDNDSSMTADTDDQLDFKLGGSDVISFKITGIHLPDGEKYVAGTGDDLQLYHDGTNSYLANSTGALRVATLTSGIAITLGHTTSEVTVADNLTVVGNLTVGGTTNFGDFDISNVGSIALDTITNDGTDITLDSSGDIVLDAGGNDIFFKAGGTTIGEITNASSDLVIKSSVSDKDILIKGNDGGSAITALTLDMSDAGAATFNDKVTIGDGKLVLNSTAVTSTAAELNLLDGVSGLVKADLTKLAAIDATAAEINFIDGGATIGTTAVADGDGIIHNDGGTMKVTSATTFKTYFQEGLSLAYDDFTVGDAAVLITTSSGNITVDAAASDSDIIFRGTDGGADSLFLTIDGSAAGQVQFNDGSASLPIISNTGDVNTGLFFSAADTMAFSAGGTSQFTMADGVIAPVTDSDVDLGTSSLYFKDAFIDTITTTGAITASGIVTGTGFTAGNAVLTEAELEKLDGVTNGTVIASKVLVADSNIDITGGRNITISGEIDAATGDFSGVVDIAGQLTVADGSAGAPSISNTGDANTGLLFSAADTLAFSAGGTSQFTMADGLIAPVTDNDVDLGTNSLQFKNVHVNGTTFTDALGFGTVVMTLPTADGNADQILTTDGSGTLAFVDNSGGTEWQSVKTSAYTASAGEGVFANTTSAAFTVTLPAGSIGDEVSFIDYAGTFDTNTLTIAANGSEKIHGSTDNLTVDVERATLTLVFTDGTQGWLIRG